MHKKVNFSITPEVDSFLSFAKKETGLPKSQVLSFMVMRYGKKIAKDLQEYSRKEDSLEVSAFVE